MNILFPGFAIDLFLMSHEHFCTPTPERATWLSCHLGAQIPFSCKCFMTVWTCAVFWGSFLGAGIFLLFGWFLVGVFLPLMGIVASAIVAFYKASYKPHWMWLSFNCIQAILEKELCWFLQLKAKHCQCWCFSSGTELTANSCRFIQPWDQKLP